MCIILTMSTFSNFNVVNNGNIGGTMVIGQLTSPNASAALEISSINRGVLFPRMTTSQRNAIGSPSSGLIVYDNTLNSAYYYNGSAWVAVVGEITNNTLTNKTITDSSNTVRAGQLTTITGGVTISGSAAPVAGQVLVATDPTSASWQNTAFGDKYTYGENLSVSSTTSTTYQTKLTVTTASIPAGVYRISWSYEATASPRRKYFETQVLLDDVTVLETALRDPPPNGQYISIAGFVNITITTGVHNIKIQYRREAGGTAIAYIQNARVDIFKVGA